MGLILFSEFQSLYFFHILMLTLVLHNFDRVILRNLLSHILTSGDHVAGCQSKSPPTLSYQPATLLDSSLEVRRWHFKKIKTGVYFKIL